MTKQEMQAAIAAKRLARANGTVSNNNDAAERVALWADKTARRISDTVDTFESLAEQRKADGVRPVWKSLFNALM